MKKFASSILIFWLLAILVGRLLQLNPNTIDLNAILNTPNMQYLLGADDLGRSILAVSYTHLDVYKRQNFNHLFTQSSIANGVMRYNVNLVVTVLQHRFGA